MRGGFRGPFLQRRAIGRNRLLKTRRSALPLPERTERTAESTRIKTNVETGGEMSTKNFGIIDWYDYNRKGSGMAERLRYLEVKLSDWLFRAIESAEVLPISRDYFRLAQRAAGYSVHIEKLYCSEGQIIRAQTVEHYPPEVGAIKLWLGNRRPDKWKDKQEVKLDDSGAFLKVWQAISEGRA